MLENWVDFSEKDNRSKQERKEILLLLPQRLIIIIIIIIIINQDKIRTPGEKETYKYLGILEADTIEQVEMNDKIKKEYLRRSRRLLETRLLRNLIKGLTSLAVPFVRYSELFLKWTRELNQMNTAGSVRLSTGRCARNLNLTIRTNGICTTQ